MNGSSKDNKLKKKRDFNKGRLLGLIDRFLEGKTSLEEDRALLNYYESFQESDKWPEELGSEKELQEKIFVKLRDSSFKTDLNKDKLNFISRRFNIYKYAALFIGLVGLFYFFQTVGGQMGEESDSIVFEPEEEVITLKLDGGKVEIVSENTQRDILNKEGKVVGVQKGNQIIYNDIEDKKEIVYNELAVPYGKRFDLVLSDGTKIKLNSGSSIRYPIQFLEDGKRNVFLKGEAYFEVTKDENRPFVVHADDINVQVLGTEFNISHYPEDGQINTVLVEGSVKVFENSSMGNEEASTLLEPGHKAEWNRSKKEMSVKHVDVDLFTAWKDGRIIFKNMPFKNIRKKLERHYNVTIVNNNKVLDEKMYNASFDVETIEQVLKSFNENFAIEYNIVDEKIIID